MAPEEYAESRERWTFRNQELADGTKNLSPVRTQEQGRCSYYALAATLEPNLRVQWGKMKNRALSLLHLRKLDEDSRTKLPNEKRKMRRLLRMIQDEGVFEDEQYHAIQERRLRARDARMYKITRFTQYSVADPEDIRRALYELRRGGPLLAVIRISENYNECYNSGHIYRFDPNTVVKDPNGARRTHALCVVSFVLEAKVPCLECQDSHGPGFGSSGFLLVDITSLIELYSIRIRQVVPTV